MFNVTVTTGPSVEPVTVEEAKEFCRIDISDDDTLLTNLIKAAREASERYTGRAYINQTVKVVGETNSRMITLPRPPQSAISTVKYLDSAGAWQALTLTTDYTVIAVGSTIAVYISGSPYVNENGYYTVEIVYTAGYGAAAINVPYALKQAILNRVAAMYENRGNGTPNYHNARALEGPYRRVLP